MATQNMRKIFEQTEGLTLIEDTRPLPGIDWQINVDVEKAEDLAQTLRLWVPWFN